jgi:organic hydroperoxide reductase OsmC/OhrA
MNLFKLTIFQRESETLKQNNRKRIQTIQIPDSIYLPEFNFQLPLAYDGPKGEDGLRKYYTPEHFFLAAVSGCFFTTFSVVSSNSKLKYKTLKINAEGCMDTSTGIKIMEKIENKITLIIPSTEKKKKALKVLKLTEKACPLSNSVKTKIENTYNIVVE